MRPSTPLQWGLLLVLVLSIFRPARAQETAPTSPTMGAGETSEALTVDGRLREGVWEEAPSVTGFRQYEPDEGAPASVRTRVRVVYGDDHLYVGAQLHDQHPQRIQATLGRRDEWNQADWFLVSLDSDLDRRQAFAFGVNAAGVQLDATRSGGDRGPGPGGLDPSWDAVWYSDVRVTSEGWVAELKIPYSMLRFPSSKEQTWGIHFTRSVPRLGEQAEWPLVPRGDRGNFVAQFGRLTGMTGLEARRNVQVRPYTLGRAESLESDRAPGTANWNGNLDVGGNVRVGLGSNTTLDLTVNPDFGQVESDPAVLNLSAFETFFDEKRPFFVEGINKFEFSVGPGELLYTRRIGALAPIIGAAKFAGRTDGDLSYGVLGATTGEGFDPVRHYGVTRLKQQIEDYSSIGGILTGFSGPAVQQPGRRSSLSGGLDWDLRFANNRYGVEGFTALTHLRRPTLEDGQQTGGAGKVWIRKRQGDWTGFLGVDMFGDQFSPNDLGQLRENNMIVMLNSIDYNINSGEPFGPFRRANVGTFTTQSFSFREGLDRGLSTDLNSEWMLRGFQEIQLSGTIENPFGGYDLYETRGLGPWQEPASLGGELEFETDRRRKWQIEPEIGYRAFEDGGQEYSARLEGNVNVGSRLSLSSTLEAEWERDVTAWTANETIREMDDGWQIGRESGRSPNSFVPLSTSQLDERLQPLIPVSTRPQEYYLSVFGERDTRSVDVTARGTITFTPQLSLQLYGQLFVAQGQYEDFSLLQTRDTRVPFDEYPKRDEFAIQSFQSNTVLRWQYRPGSTLFLVWTHGRRANPRINPLASRPQSLYDQPLGEHVSETFGLFPRNTFILKVSYTVLR